MAGTRRPTTNLHDHLGAGETVSLFVRFASHVLFAVAFAHMLVNMRFVCRLGLQDPNVNVIKLRQANPEALIVTLDVLLDYALERWVFTDLLYLVLCFGEGMFSFGSLLMTVSQERLQGRGAHIRRGRIRRGGRRGRKCRSQG